MTFGSMPYFWPTLCIFVSSVEGVLLSSGSAYSSQCLTIALVESMIVPSISKSKPLKLHIIGGLENVSTTPLGAERFVVVLPTEIAILVGIWF